ncbi:nuclear transport factor 2 family protein [Georgenia sp. MJ206]|uniref:nuclear transport factor 2 family protein n=1 Tax=Georgenia wangjunii TaxID=3117730 RepID=UPI002F262ED6
MAEDEQLTSALLAVERRGWDSLCDGSGAELYGALMTAEAVMVLAHGVVLDRAGVVASLADAPRWRTYELDDVRLVPVGADAAALVYTARAYRDGEPPFESLMSSTYVRAGGAWRLALYQQTPLPSPTDGSSS